jgi:hypothetical protein
MPASILIIVFCGALLIYWLRATAILLIREFAVRTESQLHDVFTSVHEQALAGEAVGPLHDALRRDARVLKYLLKQASEVAPGEWEDTLLLWDYRLMECWFSISRLTLPTQARKALAAMAQSLDVLQYRLAARAQC